MSVLGEIQQEPLFNNAELLNRDRLVRVPDFRGVDAFIMDIPESIPQLGYGSHQFFRYYGKFPSVLGREMVRHFAVPDRPVVDCYAGSGTTLVEAQIAGHRSVGLDINPLGVLASNVKTRYYDRRRLHEVFEQVVSLAGDARVPPWTPTETSSKKLEKWFTDDAIVDLGAIRAALDRTEPSPEKDYLVVCFLAIVRRCSNAFDGEVRPHVNREKRPREPVAAFRDKFADMIAGLGELDRMRPADIPSSTTVADNRDRGQYPGAAGSAGLVVAHPPYLNSFNYLHAFSLEFMWAEGIAEVWLDRTLKEVQALESKAWPATNPLVLEEYYGNLRRAVAAAGSCLGAGGYLALVVGDATIRGKLEPVHAKAWDIIEDEGLEPVQTWFRTTHYGIGKYAYSHRADYHGEAEKKDAILFFKKN